MQDAIVNNDEDLLIKEYSNREFDNQIFNTSYTDLIANCYRKYGPVNDDYMIFVEDYSSCYKNPKLVRPDNTVIHHIDEDTIPCLCNPDVAINFPETQLKEHLIYANDLEHGAMHYRIAIESQPDSGLGLGGIINYGLLNNYSLNNPNFYKDYLTLLGRLYFHCHSYNRFISENIKTAFMSVYTDKIIKITKGTNNIEHLDCLDYTHLWIIKNYPVGISKITPEIYFEGGNPFSKRIAPYKEIYLLRTKSNITAAVVKIKTGFSLIYGGSFSPCPFMDIESIYKHLDELYLKGNNTYSIISDTILTPLSKYIQSIGGDGKVHGLIVNIDYEHHIMFIPQSEKFICYYSNMGMWNNGRQIKVYNSPLKYLQDHFKNSQKQLMSTDLVPVSLKLLLNNESQEGTTALSKKPKQIFTNFKPELTRELQTGYTNSRQFGLLDKSIKSKHFVVWPEQFDQNYKWDNNDINLQTSFIAPTRKFLAEKI